MKARKVKGLDPDGAFDENARRIVQVRLGELTSLASGALENGSVDDLHDARIAAKRLRYVLELAGPALGRPAATAALVARGLQDLLGEIHDCDVMLARIRRHGERLRAEDAEAVRLYATRPGAELEVEAAQHAGNLERHWGLEALTAFVSARRKILLERFASEWKALERRDFAGKLLARMDPPPPDAGT
jgi:CHAD domain-containing protein